MKRRFFTIGLLLAAQVSFAQEATTQHPFYNWHNESMADQQTPGVGTDKAYAELLKGKKGKKIVVAVIDSGVDIEHEDLKDVIWVNKDEIPNNGKDDDNNGYIDDVNGWNFIGGTDGSHLNDETLELTREYRRLSEKFEGVKAKEVAKADRDDYKLYDKVKHDFFKEVTETTVKKQEMQALLDVFEASEKVLAGLIDVNNYGRKDIEAIIEENKDEEILLAANRVLPLTGFGKKGVQGYFDYLDGKLNTNLNIHFNPRAEIIGDDYANTGESNYGNNQVEGPDALHGTHVAGIIAATRNNGIGMNGVADNAEIMVIRAIPNGDEYDKDVANSIVYAVDNGAKIINMSFGKKYSPQKSVVDKAMKYADARGVLLIHAAGNASENIDEITHYPTRHYAGKGETKNWLEIGASSKEDNQNLTARFSNYGEDNVDVFAPGVSIYSTVPDNEYQPLSGTSMATPATAGCAALIWSYYPELTAQQLKVILKKSATKIESYEVRVPGEFVEVDGKKVPKTEELDEISITGGLVNVYEALKMAEKVTKGELKL